MWPLVILGAAAWYLTRPGRNPQLSFFETLDRPADPPAEQSHELRASTIQRARRYGENVEELRKTDVEIGVATRAIKAANLSQSKAMGAVTRAAAKVENLRTQGYGEALIVRAERAWKKALEEYEDRSETLGALRKRLSALEDIAKHLADRLDKEADSLYEEAGYFDRATNNSEATKARMRQLRALMRVPQD